MNFRPAWAEIDLDAVTHNASLLAAVAAPARLCAVVKADGYGHGAVPVARAALAGGAEMLAVALVEEGVELRDAGLDVPILVLSEPPAEAWPEVVAQGLEPAVYTARGIAGLRAAVAAHGGASASNRRRIDADGLPVHLKVDTGMHRVGAAPESIVELAESVESAPELRLEAVWTHCAVADEPEDPFTAEQVRRFDETLDALSNAGIRPRVQHVANSAATIAHPASRRHMVRCGIALYGIAPSPALAGRLDLRPAMGLVSRVAHVARLPAGERVSYGLRYRTAKPSTIATVPIGYADGVRRRLGAVGGQVLVGGRRRPIAGTVTMDQIMVDCGDDDIEVGAEVVLIGRQGDEEITVEEWAERLDTIGYEVVCGIGQRVPRHHLAQPKAKPQTNAARIPAQPDDATPTDVHLPPNRGGSTCPGA